MTDRAYVVVPFQRVGITVGAQQAFMFPAAAPAKLAAQQIALRAAGVAVIEQSFDPETGEDQQRLIAGYGAVPPRFPDSADWTLKLN